MQLPAHTPLAAVASCVCGTARNLPACKALTPWFPYKALHFGLLIMALVEPCCFLARLCSTPVRCCTRISTSSVKSTAWQQYKATNRNTHAGGCGVVWDSIAANTSNMQTNPLYWGGSCSQSRVHGQGCSTGLLKGVCGFNSHAIWSGH